MGKYNMQDDRERLKAIARKKKEKALKKDKPQELNLKRKGTEGDQVKKSASVKKPRASNEGDEADPAQGLTSATVESGAEQDKSKEIVSEPRKMTKSSSASLKLKPFLDDVVQTFSRSTAGKSSSSQTDSEKFHLAFNQSAMAFYAQYEMLIKFDSLEGPLRDHIADLARQLAKAEEEVESANMVIKKRESSLVQMQALKEESNRTIEALKIDLVFVTKKSEVEIEELRDQIAGLSDRVDQLLEENVKLERGEGVDLEAIIDSDEFAEIKESMDDAAGDQLVRRIKAIHPEWDLSFLPEARVDPKASEVDRNDGATGGKGTEVDPIDGDETEVDPELEGGSL